MPKDAGFTLIEILTSIIIMAIIFGVVITSSVAIQKSSRDSKRISDLRSIQGALQQYYADTNCYPLSLPSGSLTSSSNHPGTPPCISPSSSKTYMNNIPKDPTANSPYSYTSYISDGITPCSLNNACTTYCLSATLENSQSAATAPPPCSSAVTTFYGVSPN